VIRPLLELGLRLEEVLEHEPLVTQLLQASLELMLALALLLVLVLVLTLMPELLQKQMIHLPESRPLSLGKDCHQSSL
jgi:hypothetical protein